MRASGAAREGRADKARVQAAIQAKAKCSENRAGRDMVVLSNDGLNIDRALEPKLRLRRTLLIVTGSWRLLQTFERSGSDVWGGGGSILGA
jgi:hypothetical protein